MAAVQVKTMQETFLFLKKEQNSKIEHPAAAKQTEFSQKFSLKETLWN